MVKIPLYSFQSTRPVWDATHLAKYQCGCDDISIHAPRVGRDVQQREDVPAKQDFNPRAPCGARLHDKQVDKAQEVISIHAPRVGRDNLRFKISRSRSLFQSTRPVWGATPAAGADDRRLQHFNPRAPCGARHRVQRGQSGHKHFNPRAPCGARRPSLNLDNSTSSISIHAPRVGRDENLCGLQCTLEISIHAPRVGRDESLFFTDVVNVISIHAPRVGRDDTGKPSRGATGAFQSTRPVWGATVVERIHG